MLSTVGTVRRKGTVMKFIQLAVSGCLVSLCYRIIKYDVAFSGTETEKTSVVIMRVRLSRSVPTSFHRNVCTKNPKVFDVGATTSPLCVRHRVDT